MLEGNEALGRKSETPDCSSQMQCCLKTVVRIYSMAVPSYACIHTSAPQHTASKAHQTVPMRACRNAPCEECPKSSSGHYMPLSGRMWRMLLSALLLVVCCKPRGVLSLKR